MSFPFWLFAIAMLLVAIGFVAVPLKTGKPLLSSPAILIALSVPAAALGLYALLGSPEHIATPHATATSNPALGSVASMADGLRARLEKEPGDADGWILLARSYQHLGQQAEAVDAYEHAVALGKNDMTLESSLLGEALSSEMLASTPGPALRGRVALAPEALALVQPGDTLFVFAKESRAHRMPVAALRRSVTDLPLDFELSDKEIMIPDTHLSDYPELVVTAKISRSGNASDSSLQLEAWSEVVSPSGTDRIDLLIGSAHE